MTADDAVGAPATEGRHRGGESPAKTPGFPRVENAGTAAPADAHAAFSRYVMPEIEVMHRVAYSITRNEADAEDLVQDTMLRAFRSVARFDGQHSRAWLLTIMRNAQMNRVRRRRPGLLNDGDEALRRAASVPDPAPGPEDVAMHGRFDAVVEIAYGDLPGMFREAIDLVDLGGLSYEEAATVLDVPRGTVMSRLHRGRKRIRESLRSAGVDVDKGRRP